MKIDIFYITGLNFIKTVTNNIGFQMCYFKKKQHFFLKKPNYFPFDQCNKYFNQIIICPNIPILKLTYK